MTTLSFVLKTCKSFDKVFRLFKGIVVNNSSTQIHVREFLVIFFSFAFIDLWLYLFQRFNFLVISKLMSKISRFSKLVVFPSIIVICVYMILQLVEEVS